MSFSLYFFLLALPQFCAWLYQQKVKKADIVDITWCFSFAAAAVYILFHGEGLALARFIAGVFVLIWSLRLGSHLVLRSRGAPEDPRYAGLRARLGDKASRVFFFIFQAQAVLNALLLTAVVILAELKEPLFSWQLPLAALIFFVALVGESLADRQLANFKKDAKNKGEVCKTGLWRFSRHPNYFFEWVYWCGYPVLAMGADNWPWAFIAPLVMFVFLNYVTGVPYSEKMSLQSRGDKYRAYQAQTSRFFIWPPKSQKSVEVIDSP